MLILVVLSVLIYLVEKRIVTESEQVEEALYHLADAVKQDELVTTLSWFSPKAAQLRDLVTRAIQRYNVQDDLRITDVQVTLKSDNTLALSRFRANATVVSPQYGNIGYRHSLWEFSWQRFAGEWRIVSLLRFNPHTGEVMNPLTNSEQ